MMNICPQCNGTGIGEYFDHGSAQHGEEAIEPIRCDICDGFGYYDQQRGKNDEQRGACFPA